MERLMICTGIGNIVRRGSGMVAVYAFVGAVAAVCQETAKPTPTPSMLGSMFPMIVVMVAIFYFFFIRPEQKKHKDRQKLMDSLKKGDKVVTIGGIHGTVGTVKADTVMIKIAENTVVEITRAAVASILSSNEKAAEKEEQ
jgi:preprotein translocase subunit YajC